MDAWLRSLVEAQEAGRALAVEDLVRALGGAGAAEPWVARARFDEAVPYGRSVVHAEGGVEVMIAGWSRGQACAPHDHGSGIGAVRVLQGRAGHRSFELRDGELRAGDEQRLEAGAVVRCPRGVVHQMRDADGERPLVTLHLYWGCRDPMVVYDLDKRQTQWLAVDCGAWVRPQQDPKAIAWSAGFVPRP